MLKKRAPEKSAEIDGMTFGEITEYTPNRMRGLRCTID